MLEEEIIVIEDETEEEIVVLEEAIEKVYPELQNKTVTPTKEEQKIKADSGIYGLSEVTIEPVTNEIDENIKAENIKSGTTILGVEGNVVELVGEEITIAPKSEEQEFIPTAPANGFTKVKVEAQTGIDPADYFTTTITSSNYNRFGTNYFIKQTPAVYVDSSTISLEYAFYGASFIKEIEILGDTSKVTRCSSMFSGASNLQKVNAFDTQNVTNMYSMFYQNTKLTEVPFFNTQKVTTMSAMFQNASAIKEIPQFDTQSLTDMSTMLYGASKLEKMPKLKANKVTSISDIFNGTKSNFTDFGGLENLGMNYGVGNSANYSSYKLNLSSCNALTEQSLINVLTNLYDIATKGCKTQTVQLGSTNLAKLTSEAGQQALAQATAYGWTVS